jgi:hypothetical protein
MIKTKGMEAGKAGSNYPAGATLTGTEKTRVGGQMPATAALPTMADQPAYMNQTPNAQVIVPQDSASLPMFSPSTGYSDGAAHMGDLGGAGGVPTSTTESAIRNESTPGVK